MKVRDLLTPKSWIQDFMAKNDLGFGVDVNDARACKWCLLGAINKCYGRGNLAICKKVAEAIDPEVIDDDECHVEVIVNYNDFIKRNYNDIAKLLEKVDI